MADKFDNGKSYTLKKLLSGDTRFVIPDLQRDYCWGTTETLVSDFMNSLKDLFNNKVSMKLGLIYGYETVPSHIYLCDGQQRMTTLFLLLGVLNRKTNKQFKDSLLMKDSKSLRLQYAIRESTLYFMEDLSKHFFLENDVDNVRSIRNQPWYFNDYDFDPSIQSMLSALDTIESIINSTIEDAEGFGSFILSSLEFLYIDLKTRKNGEETFVVINTTGEPLSVTENLKPQLITKQAPEFQSGCSKKWEELEQFFWQNRGNNDTADNGLKEFFRWVTLLNLNRNDESEKAEFEHIQENNIGYTFSTILNTSFKDICIYFEIVRCLFSEEMLFKDELELIAPDETGNNQIDLFRLLPVIAYCKKFDIHAQETPRNLLRVAHFFSNIAKFDDVSKTVGDLLPKAIDIIGRLPDVDIISMLDMNDVSTQILTDEEKWKFKLYANKVFKREELENRFWKEESHPVWNGEIQPLLEWSTKNGVFDLNLYDKYANVFNTLFHDDMEYEELDITRRALLTLNLEEYPKIFRGYKNYSFCWEYSDWKTLITENVKVFGEFISELSSVSDIYAKQNEMIQNSSKKFDYNLGSFVRHPELLTYCEYKNVQKNDDWGTWWLIPKTNASRYFLLENYILFLDLQKIVPTKDWDISRYEYEDTWVVFDRENDGTAINLFYSGNKRYGLQLFNRDDSLSKTKYKSIAAETNLHWNGELYESDELTLIQLKTLLKKLL